MNQSVDLLINYNELAEKYDKLQRETKEQDELNKIKIKDLEKLLQYEIDTGEKEKQMGIRERKELNEKIKTVEEILIDNDIKMNNMKKDLEQKENENEELKEKLEKINCNELAEKYDKLERETKEQDEINKIKMKDLEKLLQYEIDTGEKEKQMGIRERKELNEKIKTVDEILIEKDLEMNNIKKELEQKENEKEELKEKLEKVNIHIEKDKITHNEGIYKLKKDVEQKEKEKEDLKEELKKMNEKMEKEKIEKNKEMKMMEERMKDLNDENGRILDELVVRKNEIKQLRMNEINEKMIQMERKQELNLTTIINKEKLKNEMEKMKKDVQQAGH